MFLIIDKRGAETVDWDDESQEPTMLNIAHIVSIEEDNERGMSIITMSDGRVFENMNTTHTLRGQVVTAMTMFTVEASRAAMEALLPTE